MGHLGHVATAVSEGSVILRLPPCSVQPFLNFCQRALLLFFCGLCIAVVISVLQMRHRGVK